MDRDDPTVTVSWVSKRRVLVAVAVCCAAIGGCGETDDQEGEDAWWSGLPYAMEVVEFAPGDGAGFGQEEMPEVVLGPPDGQGTTSASLDVLSLGDRGEIVVGFDGREIVDGDGADFVVFENPFWPGGDPDRVFAELGEVSVSADGETWHVFECDYDVDDPPPYPGCAGWTPTLDYDPEQVVPLDPETTGGDAFDLGDVGVDRARFVRIRDVWGVGEAPSRGFDLDAVGLIHFDEAD